MSQPSFPAVRMRRARSAPWMRDMLAEHRLHTSDLIWPLFICEGDSCEEPIAALPGVRRWSVDRLATKAREARDLGIPCIALFPNTPSALRSEGGVLGNSAMHGMPRSRASRALAARRSTLHRRTPDSAAIGSSQLSPSQMNKGQMRSEAWSRCSASMSRIHGAERARRMRVAGNDELMDIARAPNIMAT